MYSVLCAVCSLQCEVYSVQCLLCCVQFWRLERPMVIWSGLEFDCCGDQRCRTSDCNVMLTLYCTVLYCTTLHYTSLYCIVLHFTTLHCTALHYIILNYTTQHCTAMYCTVLHCIALHTTVLRCTALQCNFSPLYCSAGKLSADSLWLGGAQCSWLHLVADIPT